MREKGKKGERMFSTLICMGEPGHKNRTSIVASELPMWFGPSTAAAQCPRFRFRQCFPNGTGPDGRCVRSTKAVSITSSSEDGVPAASRLNDAPKDDSLYMDPKLQTRCRAKHTRHKTAVPCVHWSRTLQHVNVATQLSDLLSCMRQNKLANAHGKTAWRSVLTHIRGSRLRSSWGEATLQTHARRWAPRSATHTYRTVVSPHHATPRGRCQRYHPHTGEESTSTE